MGKFESVYAYTWDKYRALTVSVSPDGRLAVTGGFGDEKNLALWEVATGKLLRILPGHKKGVEEALFSPDGSYLFSRGLDETLRLWEVSSGQCLNVFRWGKAESLALSPDGRYLLSAAADALRLWALDWELKACPVADWDEGARPYLEAFLANHTPPPSGLFRRRNEAPSCTEADFQQLLYTLGCRGYGALRPEGVRQQLTEMINKDISK